MSKRTPTIWIVAAVCALAGGASAQTTPSPTAAAAAPEKMPFATPYGAPISLARAQGAIAAAVAEAEKRGWAMNVAVFDSGANLVAFARMDGAQLASAAIAEHKARAAASFRRPTQYFEEALQKAGSTAPLTLDGMIASRGGIPLVEGGKLIGAIGCSGGTGAQDETTCEAGAATIGK